MLTLLLLAAAPASPPLLEAMKTEAKAYAPQVKSDWVKQWMTAVSTLPSQPKRVFWRTKDRKEAFTEAAYAKLPDEKKKDLEKKECDDDVYYGRITEPLGYARPYDVLAGRGFQPKGKSVLDFGYGNIGQLEGLVKLGAKAGGIEVDPILPMLYEKANRPALRIFHGYFAGDTKLVKAVGQGWDVVLSKNTLKKGYVHPESGAKGDIDLGVSDDDFLKLVYGMLNPGGFFYIYNISPGPSDKPWSDGRSPFAKDTYEKAGFSVLAFDEDDSPAVRAMGKAFGWDQPQGEEPGTDLEHDLFAHYTLVQKPLKK